MVSLTPNHEFQLFADDETPWEHRTDFQKLDGRTPIVDTAANRVNYEAKTNALYFASDADTIYRGNGSSWVLMGELGSEGGGTDFGTAADPVASITNTHYREVTNEASVSGDYTVDLTTANVHALTLTGDTTLTFSGDHPDLTTGCTLIIQQDATGGHALSWGDSIFWPGGSQPALSTDPGTRHKLVIENVAGTWEGGVVGEDYIEIDPAVIEDFETGDISGYTGNTGSYTVSTAAPVFEGSYSLKTNSPTFGDKIYSVDTLPNLPSKGDTFGAWVHLTDLVDNRPGILFGLQDANNYYGARIVQGSADYADSIQLIKNSAGTFSVAQQTAVTLTGGAWYDIQINWQADDTIACTLYDEAGTQQATATTIDADYAAEDGFGWYMGASGGNAAYDYARFL